MPAYSPSCNLGPIPYENSLYLFSLQCTQLSHPTVSQLQLLLHLEPPHEHEGQSLQPDRAYSRPTARRHGLHTPNALHHVAVLCGRLDCRSLFVCPHGTHTPHDYKWLGKKRAKGWKKIGGFKKREKKQLEGT